MCAPGLRWAFVYESRCWRKGWRTIPVRSRPNPTFRYYSYDRNCRGAPCGLPANRAVRFYRCLIGKDVLPVTGDRWSPLRQNIRFCHYSFHKNRFSTNRKGSLRNPQFVEKVIILQETSPCVILEIVSKRQSRLGNTIHTPESVSEESRAERLRQRLNFQRLSHLGFRDSSGAALRMTH